MADLSIPLIQRGEHNIEDELVFSRHDGYVFHDSRGFEGGSEDELKIVQEFVRRRSQEKRLKDRLHAIWFVPFNWVLNISNSQRPAFQVLCSDGQFSAIARIKTLRQCLPG
jgi:hypothetical protein